MSPMMVGLIAFLILFALMAAGMPIGFAMALIGFIGYIYLGGWSGALSILTTTPFDSVSSYTLTVIPLFVLMGELAAASGLIGGAFAAAQKWLGRMQGGLAIATIGACAAFAAVSGSSMATAGAMTSIAYPEMKRYNYDSRLATGSIAAGGTLGILIPPSVVFIMYAIFAEESIGKLYMAGLIPGILLAVLFMIAIYLQCKMNPALGPRGPDSSLRVKLVSLKYALPVLILAVLVLGGIWGGVFTPNEAAGVGVVIAFIMGLIVRKLSLKNFTHSLMETISISAMVFVILIGAMIFNYFIVLTGIPNGLSELVTNLAIPKYGILAVILFIYLLLGCIMDSFAMTVLTLPIFLPVLSHLGFDLIWFGVIFVIMIEMSSITPPVGMNVFVVAGMVREVPMYTIFRGIIPFFFCLVIIIFLLTTLPQIALFLPHTMMK
jgi:C4-dicarboxylate transporter, DctM subunit